MNFDGAGPGPSTTASWMTSTSSGQRRDRDQQPAAGAGVGHLAQLDPHQAAERDARVSDDVEGHAWHGRGGAHAAAPRAAEVVALGVGGELEEQVLEAALGRRAGR